MLGQWALGTNALGEPEEISVIPPPGPSDQEVEAEFTWTLSTACDNFVWFLPGD